RHLAGSKLLRLLPSQDALIGPIASRELLVNHGGWIAFRVRLRSVGQHRSEEHTSELQSLAYLVCRLLLEKKKYCQNDYHHFHSPESQVIVHYLPARSFVG